MTPVFANVLQPLIDGADWILLRLHDAGFSWGLSIILMTVIIRLAIVPLTIRQIRSMNALRELQPQIKVIQEKYKDNRQQMNQAMMRFYQENKVNPLASCLPLLLQLPVFMSLFYLLRGVEFRDRLEASGEQSFLFINDLAHRAHSVDLVILMILFVGSQLASTLVISVTADKTQQRIMLLLPLFFAFLIPNFPAGLILYWITTNFWTLGQQLVVRKIWPPPPAVVAGASVGGGSTGASSTEQRKPPPPPRKKKRRRR
jgi:YidC/Oxa1 family membrane protein insertase